jgi:hypothetical protein
VRYSTGDELEAPDVEVLCPARRSHGRGRLSLRGDGGGGVHFHILITL